jgi:hypothetical protein
MEAIPRWCLLVRSSEKRIGISKDLFDWTGKYQRTQERVNSQTLPPDILEQGVTH